jgi:heme/copper-type cytochrome/quinol oxidase subunit 2
MQHALQNLSEVKVVPYEPDAPKAHNMRRQIIIVTLIIIAIFVVVILIGIIAQLAHNAAH